LKFFLKIIALSALMLIMHPFIANADQAGTKAPPFRLVDTAGTVVTLEDFAGKILMITFWASWCASCREGFPALDQLYNQYQDQGFAVIGINVDASPARVAAFLRNTPVKFPILIDSKGETAEAYRLSGLPTIFIIDRDGVVKHRHSGYEKGFSRIYDQEIRDLLKQ
jgi:peroxiredoxin